MTLGSLATRENMSGNNGDKKSGDISDKTSHDKKSNDEKSTTLTTYLA